jgi:hypothetical protein
MVIIYLHSAVKNRRQVDIRSRGKYIYSCGYHRCPYSPPKSNLFRINQLSIDTRIMKFVQETSKAANCTEMLDIETG